MTPDALLPFPDELAWVRFRALTAACRGSAFSDLAALEKYAERRAPTGVIGFTLTVAEALDEIRALRTSLPKLRAKRIYPNRPQQRRRAG